MAGVTGTATRWLVVGPYPPEQGAGPAAAAAFVAEQLATGATVHAVSPRPTAAHEHLQLDGLRGVLALRRLAKAQRADGLWLRVEPRILLRSGVDRRRALVERGALALLLRTFTTSVLDVGDASLLPGGRAGRPVFATASRFVTHRRADADALIASGAPPAKVALVGDELPGGAAPLPDASHPPASVAYPEPAGLRDLSDSRAEIEAAVRDRAAQLRAARTRG